MKGFKGTFNVKEKDQKFKVPEAFYQGMGYKTLFIKHDHAGRRSLLFFEDYLESFSDQKDISIDAEIGIFSDQKFYVKMEEFSFMFDNKGEKEMVFIGANEVIMVNARDERF